MTGSSAHPSGVSALYPKPRLLLAEDDAANRGFLGEVLQSDYEVEVVCDGSQAWAAAQRELPDLILSDVLMPGLDGIGLTRQLRADGRTAAVPIILLTASDEKEMRIEGLQAGADDYLIKPFSSTELLARLRSHRELIDLRRETAARRGDERYRLIVNSARDYAIFAFDAQRRVTSWNAGAEFITGFRPEDIIGQPVDLLYTSEDQEVPEREMREARAHGRYDNERWHMRKDGSRFWGSGVVMPLREDGPDPGCLKILRDLTAAHEAEEDRKRLLALEQAARRDAEDANAAKDRFLAALSHELRTPLAPVQIALFLMGREKDLPASVRDGMDMIQRCVATEIQLIGDLLDVSRIVHGKLELDPQPMDLHGCIRQSLEVCAEDFRAKSLTLEVALAADSSQVSGDSARLQQVFWNLFKNAAKFTPEKGRLTVRSRNVGQEIEVAVSDSGLGIPADALAKIFEPFEQGDPDRTRVYGGLGLGLAISRAIIAAHGGGLTAESPGPDRGSTFRVRLAMLPE